MITDNLTLFTCTYNSNFLLKIMVMSFFKQIKKDIQVVILDNGNKEPCDSNFAEQFTVIDNKNYKLTPYFKDNISQNHCASIDYALKNCIKTKYVLLCDCDIIFKKSIKTFFDYLDTLEDFDCIGEVGYDVFPPNRLFPYFCLINVDKFKSDNINYFDKKRCAIRKHGVGLYDTRLFFLC